MENSNEAVSKGEVATVAELLEMGVGVNILHGGEMALMLAIHSGHRDIVELLLKHGADVNTTFRYKETALMKASFRGYLDIVELLIENGADINARDSLGRTALIEVSQYQYGEQRRDIVELLIENGVDTSATDWKGWTARMHASAAGNNEIVKVLRKQEVREAMIKLRNETRRLRSKCFSIIDI